MGKVIYDISMSLDGFITGANPHPEAGWGGLGEGGERLHDWGFNSADPRNRKSEKAMMATLGAVIAGSHTYDHSILNWGANGPTGDLRTLTVIVSHSVPQDVPNGGVYTFVEALRPRIKQRKKRQAIRMSSYTARTLRSSSSRAASLTKSSSTSPVCCSAVVYDCSSRWAANMSRSKLLK